MPVIDRIGQWRVLFYANDHAPKHVHMIIKGSNRGAKIWLHDASLASNSMLRQYEIKEAVHLVKQHQKVYEEAWDAFFSS